MDLTPIPLNGNWDEGYALDLHTLSSEYLGDDAYGHPHFDTKYTVLGDLVKRFKYRGEHDLLLEIMSIVSPFLQEWQIKDKINVVLPVPPSNLNRSYQPVFELAKAIAGEVGAYFNKDVLVKNTREQAKSMEADKKDLTGCITTNCYGVEPLSLLLVDDLYQTGSTLRECTRILRQDPNVQHVYVLTMTKTRSK